MYENSKRGFLRLFRGKKAGRTAGIGEFFISFRMADYRLIAEYQNYFDLCQCYPSHFASADHANVSLNNFDLVHTNYGICRWVIHFSISIFSSELRAVNKYIKQSKFKENIQICFWRIFIWKWEIYSNKFQSESKSTFVFQAKSND